MAGGGVRPWPQRKRNFFLKLLFNFVPNLKQNIFYFKVFFGEGGEGMIYLVTELKNRLNMTLLVQKKIDNFFCQNPFSAILRLKIREKKFKRSLSSRGEVRPQSPGH